MGYNDSVIVKKVQQLNEIMIDGFVEIKIS